MKKIKISDVGSTGKDGPIYSSGLRVHFRPKKSNSLDIRNEDITVTTKGCYAIFFDFVNWEGGSCIRSEESEFIIGSTFESAQMLFNSQVLRLVSLVQDECSKAKFIAKNASWRGMSGYTAYCAMLQSPKILDTEDWTNIFCDVNDNNMVSRYQLRNFWGRIYEPTDDHDFFESNIDYVEIKDLLIDKYL